MYYHKSQIQSLHATTNQDREPCFDVVLKPNAVGVSQIEPGREQEYVNAFQHGRKYRGYLLDDDAGSNEYREFSHNLSRHPAIS